MSTESTGHSIGNTEHGENAGNAGHHEMHHWFESLLPQQYHSTVEFFAHEGESEANAKAAADTIFSSWIVCITLIVLAVLGRLSLQSTFAKEENSKFFAEQRFSVRTFFELYVDAIKGLSDSMVGHKNTKQFFWLFGGLFLYILSNNLLGLLPGAVSPSQNISSNLAMGLVVVVFFTYIGFQRQGFGFIKHMAGPVWYMAPLIFVIEMFSTFIVRPASLSLRLAGNLSGDHAVLGIAYQFAEYILPTVALALGTFVSFVQAFVFTLLTIIYVVFSLEHDDHH